MCKEFSAASFDRSLEHLKVKSCFKSRMQPCLWCAWLCTAASYTPLEGRQGSLHLDVRAAPLHGKDFVRRLGAAGKATGIPEGWPDIALDVESVKGILELERSRILAWQAWSTQQKPRCGSGPGTANHDHVGQNRINLRGSRSRDPARFWSTSLAPILVAVFGYAALYICFCRRWWGHMTVPHFGPDLDVLAVLPPATQERDTAQQTDLCVPSSEEPQDSPCRSVKIQTAQQEFCSKQLPPPWLCDDVQPPWSRVRHGCRFMLQPQSWNESFDSAYLGMVEESEDEDAIFNGFGGTTRKGKWADFVVASKKFHRGDSELFQELYFGLLISSSPTLGFCTTPEGEPRLVSAWLPETVLQYTKRMSSLQNWRGEQLIYNMMLAVLSPHGLGLVHCDIKPDNLMVGPDGTVYLIDYGSMSRPGDPGPMSCGQYRPPEDIVSLSWDVYSMGKLLLELDQNGLHLCLCIRELCLKMTAECATCRPCLQLCLSTVLQCACKH